MTEGNADIAIHLYEPGAGGLDRVAILLANGFAERGYITELWLTKADGPNAALIGEMVRVRMLPAYSHKRGLALAMQVPALRHMVKKFSPRVLMSAGNQSNLPVALACKGTKTAAVSKITNPIDRPGAHRWAVFLRRQRFALTARLSALTLTLSDEDADRYRNWFRSARVESVNNPYVTNMMLEAGRKRTPSRGAWNKFVTVGRMVPQKDHATMFEALAKLGRSDWQLTLIGDGPMRPELEAQAIRLGIADQIEFAGFTDPLPHLAIADLFLLSSRWEGLPAVAIEALACGCLVAATDCAPSLSRLLDNAGALATTPIGNSAAFARLIEASLDCNIDCASLLAAALPYQLDAATEDHLASLAPILETAQ